MRANFFGIGKEKLAAFFILGLLTGLTGCGSARRSEPISAPLKMTSDSVIAGKKAFMEHCDQCHPRGEAGLGPALNNKPLPGFAVRYQVRHGLGAMPAFSKDEISDEALDDVVAYLKALRHNG
jgi:mono/diheme cytochrome c family protein